MLLIDYITVLQSDTGRLVEYTKALERRIFKELGKLAPKLRDKECHLYLEFFTIYTFDVTKQGVATVY